MSNKVKEALKENKPVYGTMIQEIRNPSIMLILANIGFDFVFIDTEHGSYDLETVADLCMTARLAGIVPLVRVPDPEYHLIARPLDQGAMGVMVPRVETVAQVERIVESCTYPPVGVRGCSISRGHNDFQSAPMHEFTQQKNEDVLVILQIERKRAIDDLDAVLSVPGVDVAFMGPNDLAISLGASGLDSPEVTEATQRVVEVAAAHGLASGTHVRNTDMIKTWRERGMRMLTCHSDIGLLSMAAKETLTAMRES